MRLIPGKTKVKIELFKGVGLMDIAIVAVAMGLLALIFVSALPAKLYFCIGVVFIAALLLFRLDSEPSYVYVARIIKHLLHKKNYEKLATDAILEGKVSNDELLDDFYNNFDSIKGNKPENEPLLSKKEENELIKKENKILKSRSATKAEKDAVWLARSKRSAAKKKAKNTARSDNARFEPVEDMMAFTGIEDGFIEFGGDYYGAAIEIPPVEFRFFSPMRRKNSIENGVGKVLRTINPDFAANIVKIERPILYDHYIENEKKKIEEFKLSYEKGLINEEELHARVDILYERLAELKKLCYESKVVQPFYYIVLFDSDKKQLNNTVKTAVDILRGGELSPKRLDDKELAVFLKYTNEIDFDERDIDKVAPENYVKWAMPQTVSFKAKTTEVNHILSHNLRVCNYPTAVGDAWFASLMSIPSTKVMIKVKPMNRQKAVTSIDRSLQEINDQLRSTGIQSRIIELSTHAKTLSELLAMLQGDNEMLLNVNVYVTAYDIALTRNSPMPVQPPKSLRRKITNMKKTIKRVFSEEKLKLESLDFNQVPSFVAGQVSGYDPMAKDGRGIPSNSVASAYPWVYANVSDANGVKLGYHDGVPVLVDFFRRDSERVNSNMVIVGKSGSGKSYATKSILTNLAADDTKIFILDPENEYSELAHNLHGKIINVGNASQGRLNPFQIITALEDETDNAGPSSSYATHLQFLEEFFKQSLTDCDKDALEYLNALVDRMYLKKGITAETNLSLLKPEDYPIFDDLYDIILAEFQTTDVDYIRSMLRTLMNYISKYSTGGRNASIWNGPSTVTTDENFTVFNFQSMLANRNTTIANAQMLLVLKYIDNEIIKNREYNTKFKTKRKIAVIIDEAHVFIDAKYPIALDFMFQLAKRIRKYNGMQIVITQNIKDFVGSEELARKSTAIINACQYSFIFALSPNDMDDLCRLYEKSGGINEVEQEQIVSAPRGQAFAVMSSQHRSSFKVQVPDQLVNMFRTAEYESKVFEGEKGAALWEEYISASRPVREALDLQHQNKAETEALPEKTKENKRSHITFTTMTDEEYEKEDAARTKTQAQKEAEKEVRAEVRNEYKEEIKKDAKENLRRSVSDFYDSLGDANDGELDALIESMASKENASSAEKTAPNSYSDAEINIPGAGASAGTAAASFVAGAALSGIAAAAAPAVAPQIIVQPAEMGDKFDSAMTRLADAVENLGKINYDNIMNQVRDMIGTEGVKTSRDTGRQMPEPAEEVREVKASEEDNDKSIDDLINDILSSSSYYKDEDISESKNEQSNENDWEDEDESKSIDELLSSTPDISDLSDEDEEEDETASDNASIDDLIDQILGNSASAAGSAGYGGVTANKENAIEKMVENNEKRCVVTLDDLIAFNLKRVKA